MQGEGIVILPLPCIFIVIYTNESKQSKDNGKQIAYFKNLCYSILKS